MYSILRFRTSDSVPPMHHPTYPPMHRPMHSPMHYLMHPQILTRWAPRLAQQFCPTQCQLYMARLHHSFTDLTSYLVYTAVLVFSCIQSCSRDVSLAQPNWIPPCTHLAYPEVVEIGTARLPHSVLVMPGKISLYLQ